MKESHNPTELDKIRVNQFFEIFADSGITLPEYLTMIKDQGTTYFSSNPQELSHVYISSYTFAKEERSSSTLDQPKYIRANKDNDLHRKTHEFKSLVMNVGIDNESIDILENEFSEFLNADEPGAVMALMDLSNLYLTDDGKEDIYVKIMRLLQRFDYGDIPNSSVFVATAIGAKSVSIYSSALEVLDHWCNQEALNLLRLYEPPQNPWVKIKYEAVKKSLEGRCSTSEN